MLTIQFIGAGSANSKTLGHTNILLSQGDKNLMIDFGYLVSDGLLRQKVALKSISTVLISHIHADHVGGLEELAFVSYFVYRQKPTLLLPGDLYETLWEHSLRGGMEWISDEQGKAQRCSLESFFHVIRLKEEWTTIGSVAIKPFPVEHVPGKESYGFHIKNIKSGQRAIFTCDCRSLLPQLLAETIPEDFAHAGPIFHDCQLFEEGLSRVHALLTHLFTYPEHIRRRIYITHYGDDIYDHLEKIYQHGLHVAWPGKKILMTAI